MVRPTRLVPALVALLVACGGDAPPADTAGGDPMTDDGSRAAYLTLMGEDTLALEWMEFDGDAVDAEAIIRGNETMFGRYHLTFGEDGMPVAFRSETWDGTDDSGDLLGRTILEGDSLVVTRDGEEERYAFQAEPGAVPFVDMLHWPFEASLRWHHRAQGGVPDAVPVFSTRGVNDFEVERNADGTWALIHPSRGPSAMVVGMDGRIQMLDGTGSTRAYDLTRMGWEELDQDALAQQFAGRDMGELSGRGQVDDVVAGVHFTGHYGEPLKRGRDIFGALVAYGEWWRTGANQATHLSLDAPIVVDGETIPAGEYTLSSIPEMDGGTLIINRQTGQGGQSYDESLDQARVEMRRSGTEETVEAFTIRAVPDPEGGEGGRLELVWDDTMYWVPFTPAG